MNTAALLALICSILGAILAVLLGWKSVEAKSFVQVKGRVLDLQEQSIPSIEGLGKQKAQRVSYSYQYGVNSYLGNVYSVASFGTRIFYDPVLFESLEQAKLRDREIIVWVNPKRPKQAVLDNRVRGRFWGGVAFFWLMAFLFYGFYIAS